MIFLFYLIPCNFIDFLDILTEEGEGDSNTESAETDTSTRKTSSAEIGNGPHHRD